MCFRIDKIELRVGIVVGVVEIIAENASISWTDGLVKTPHPIEEHKTYIHWNIDVCVPRCPNVLLWIKLGIFFVCAFVVVVAPNKGEYKLVYSGKKFIAKLTNFVRKGL